MNPFALIALKSPDHALRLACAVKAHHGPHEDGMAQILASLRSLRAYALATGQGDTKVLGGYFDGSLAEYAEDDDGLDKLRTLAHQWFDRNATRLVGAA